MKRVARVTVAIVVAWLWTGVCVADKFGRAEFVASGVLTTGLHDFDKLTTKYYAGDFRGMREGLENLIKAPTFDDPAYQHEFDFKNNYYSFTFLAPNPAGKSDLVRVLTYPDSFVDAHKDADAPNVAFGSAMIPGVRQFFDVFLTKTNTDQLGSLYTFKEAQSPLLAELLKAARLVGFGDIAAHLGSKGQGFLPSEAQAQEKVYFHITKVTIPGTRGDLTIHSVLNPGTATTAPSNDTIYSDVPLQRVSLALIAAGMFTHEGHERAKVSGQTITADPLSGAISVAAVYVHFHQYISGTSEPSCAERFGLLLGYVVSPEPGAAVGLGALLFRGLTINAGYAGMLVNRPGRGLHIGDTVTTPRPLRRGVAGTSFVGFGYNF